MIKNIKRKQSEEDRSRVFGQIRDGLIEAIELEKSSGIDHRPFDMGPDPSMNSPERFSKRMPKTTFISAGSAERDAYGHRYGSELLEMDDTMMDKLRQGQQLAVEINQGEYILFIQYHEKELTAQ